MVDGAYNTRIARAVMVASILATSMAFIDATALVMVLPSLQRELNADAIQLLWVNSAYAIPLAALLMLGGALGDRFGRKRVFVTGVVTFATAALACGMSQSIDWLIGQRVLQGAGAALMIPGSLAMITQTFPKSSRGKAIGIWSGMTVVATIAGPVVGGALAGADHWRWIFFLNLPIAVIVLVLTSTRIPPVPGDGTRRGLDWLGVLLVTVGLASASFALLESPRLGFGAPAVVGALAFGLAALAGFVVWECRCTAPLIPPMVMRSRPLRVAGVVTLLLYSSWTALLFFLPLKLIELHGYPPLAAGLSQLSLMVPLAFLSLPAGKLADARGVRFPLTIGAAIVCLGFLLLALPGASSGPDTYWSSFFGGLLVLGCGLGMTMAPLSTAIINAVPGDDQGLAAGINSTLARLAGLAGIALIGPLVLLFLSQGLVASGVDAESAATLSRETYASAVALAMVDGESLVAAHVGAFRSLCLLSAAFSATACLLVRFIRDPTG